MHQNRNDWNVPPERGCRFKAHEIRGIIETAPTGMIFGVNPTLANQSQQDTAGTNTLIDDGAKIATGCDPCNVHEYTALSKLSAKISKQATGLALGVISPITYENRSHWTAPGIRDDGRGRS
jgi:hypothetical protein